jgi:hypothetical protein
MSDVTAPSEPSLEEALVDIRTLARVTLESGDPVVMRRDLEMILTIAEMVLPRNQKPHGADSF